MLSGLTFGDRTALEKEHLKEEKKERDKSKKQKKKKEKRERQKKARKQKDKGHHPDSDPGSSGDEQLQQQHDSDSPATATAAAGSPAAAAAAEAKVQREDWMTVPMARSQLFNSKQEAPKNENDKQDEEAPVVGGIRYMKPEQAAAAAAAAAAREEAAAGGGVTPVVSAAAGAAWRVRALQRAQQLAQEQGRELNEVLSERWGSAAEFAKSLAEGATTAAAADEPPDNRHRGTGGGSSRQQQQQGHSSGARPHYLSGVKSEAASMMRPAGVGSSNKLSWRRQQPAATGGERDHRDRDRGGREDRDRGGREDRDRGGREDRDRGGSRHNGRNEEQQQRQSDWIREAGAPGEQSRGRDRDPGKEEFSGREWTRDSERGRDRGRNRGREHGRDWERDSKQQLHQEQQERPAARRGAHSGSNRAGEWKQRQQQEQAQAAALDALKVVAGSMNTFSNDGSFMEQLTNQQQQQQQQPEEEEEEEVENQDQLEQGADKEQQPRSGASSLLDKGGHAQEAAGAAAGGPGSSNRSTADLLRARLGGGSSAAPAAAAGGGGGAGNRSAADLLRQRLGGKPASGAAGTAVGDGGGTAGGKEVVMLPLVDAAGRAMPGVFGRESAAEARRAQEAAAGGRVTKRVQRYGADGKRERYFADDDAVDLQTLVKRAKHGDDSLDIDSSLAANIAARARFKEADLDADAEYDYDAGLDLSESRRKRGDAQQQAARERQRQVSQFARQQRLEDSCSLCFSNPGRPKELTIAVGQSTYLALVQRGRLVEGHCCIMPAEHVASTRQVDEATWTEIRNFQKCLIQVFMAQGKEVLFLETATGLGTHRNHAMMEAIPMDADAFSKAPMYFKKALQESESEWSQHAAKAVIETKTKGLRGSIPPNFPYLYVQFGYGNGFVHVIDDERKFDKQLGRQVAVGLLRLPPEVMHRKQRADAPAVQASMAAQFRKQFDKYDWTKALD